MPEGLDRTVAHVAAEQHGAFSRAQAIECGATKRMIQQRLASGRWERMHRGVYRIHGSPPTWKQQLSAALLALGAEAAVSHRAAAKLWELPCVPNGSAPVELSVPRGCGIDVNAATIHRSRRFPSVDVTVVDGIRVTTPARTLIDLAGTLTGEALEEALDDAVRRRLLRLSRLKWRLEQIGGKGRAGTTTLANLVAARAGAQTPESVFETRLLRLLRKARLPQPAIQYEIRNGGRLVARVDLAYPDPKIAIEADGYRWHSGRARFDADLARRNAITALGWRVIHVTWAHLVERPDDIVRQLTEALRSRA